MNCNCEIPDDQPACGCRYADGKFYPRDEQAKFDAALAEAQTPAKPCAKRIATSPVTWCALPQEHDGQCSGPFPRELPAALSGPEMAKRRRW